MQAQADRLASRLARGRAQLARQLAQASQQVARARIRGGSLRSGTMQITETLVYPAAIEVVFDMMTDEAFHSRGVRGDPRHELLRDGEPPK